MCTQQSKIRSIKLLILIVRRLQHINKFNGNFTHRFYFLVSHLFYKQYVSNERNNKSKFVIHKNTVFDLKLTKNKMINKTKKLSSIE